ncbi:MAG: epimerase [Gemmatimonadales bacterium]
MKVILFGATGMVGQAVLRECLLDDGVDAVLAVGRSSTGRSHPKVREALRADLFDVAAGADFHGYDACLFCLGVSSAGMSEAAYTRLTFDLTMGWARLLARINPAMTFVYVSGAGTGGKAMWAQVKGRTEAALLALFPSAYMVRLSALRAVHGEVSKTRWTRISYATLRPLLPLVRAIAPGAVITSEELGRAMLRAARHGAPKRVLEPRDLLALGAQVRLGDAGQVKARDQ